MKSLPLILFAVACALTALPASAAIEVAESVEYAASVQPTDASCSWEASLVSSIVSHSKGTITQADKTAAASSSPRLALQVVRLNLSSSGKKSEYIAVVRANVLDGGKLIATHDFKDDNSFKNDQAACDALRALGSSLGEDVAKWVARTRFIECHDECAGIHPDETIVMAAEILMGNADAMSDAARDECHWPTTMASRLVKTFNESEPSPRATLEARPIDIEAYAGRRLVLRVTGMRAAGGGGFSGPKWLNMSGELREGPLVVASFESHVHTIRGGLTACKSLDSLSDDTTGLIVEWLRSPTLGATLK